MKDLKPGFVPVVFRIRFENETGQYYFKMNSEKYSMYPEEAEVLIQQGLPFRVLAVEEKEDVSSHTKFTEILIHTSESFIFRKRLFEGTRIAAPFVIGKLIGFYIYNFGDTIMGSKNYSNVL